MLETGVHVGTFSEDSVGDFGLCRRDFFPFHGELEPCRFGKLIHVLVNSRVWTLPAAEHQDDRARLCVDKDINKVRFEGARGLDLSKEVAEDDQAIAMQRLRDVIGFLRRISKLSDPFVSDFVEVLLLFPTEVVLQTLTLLSGHNRAKV